MPFNIQMCNIHIINKLHSTDMQHCILSQIQHHKLNVVQDPTSHIHLKFDKIRPRLAQSRNKSMY